MALVSTNPEADINGVHLVHWSNIIATREGKVVLGEGCAAVTYPWLQAAFKRHPVESTETVFEWANRMEKIKAITFQQAYLLRKDYGAYRFVYLTSPRHIN